MSYEYRNKRIIENFARRYTTNVSDEVDILFELEHVYSQASKADEYEAKAKAYDRVAEKLYARISHIIKTSQPDQRKPGYVDGLYNALDIISSELESGGSDD